MSSHQEDLDLLLSLQDRVLETPPASPSASPGYLSDHGSPRHKGPADMSDFKNVVQDCLDYVPKKVEKNGKLNFSKNSNAADVEKFSGLRIRNQLLSSAEMNAHFSDIRFVRLPAIKNLLVGDTVSGCWATIGVLAEKGSPKTSSIGQTYSIWKLGCLDEKTVSLFLFGDAYQKNCKEQAGTVFGLFNCTVRRDNMGSGFSLSVNSSKQIVKMGTSVDYGVCKGTRRDGMDCNAVINKRQGIYCKQHKSKASQRYSTTRAELKGGNLGAAFRNPQGIYVVERNNSKNNNMPAKILSVDGIRKALSNAGKVTPNLHSQGLRFLNEMAGENAEKEHTDTHTLPRQLKTYLEKRKSSNMKQDPFVGARKQDPLVGARKQEPDSKRKKNNLPQKSHPEKLKQTSGKMILLDYCSSDEEL